MMGSGIARADWVRNDIAPAVGIQPVIALDPLGYVHVAWVGTKTINSVKWWYAYHASNESGVYRAVILDAAKAGSSTSSPYFPHLSVDNLGFVHLAWRDLGPGSGKSVVLYRSDNPETGGHVPLKAFYTGGGDHIHDVNLDVTPDNYAHVMTEADSCSGGMCTLGSNIFDECFVATTTYPACHGATVPLVSAYETGLAEGAMPLNIVRDRYDGGGMQQFSSAVGPDGTRHLLIGIRMAGYAGNPCTVTPNDTGGYTVDDRGRRDCVTNERLVYHLERPYDAQQKPYNALRETRETLAVWSRPESITGHDVNNQQWPVIVVDPDSMLHVVYASQDGKIYYIRKGLGGQWTMPQAVTFPEEGYFDTIPSIALDVTGRLHMTFERMPVIMEGESSSAFAVRKAAFLCEGVSPCTGRSFILYASSVLPVYPWEDPTPPAEFEWIGPEEVVTVVSAEQLTHRDRRIVANWVDGEMLMVMRCDDDDDDDDGVTQEICLYANTDAGVSPAYSGGGTTLTVSDDFLPTSVIEHYDVMAEADAVTVLSFTVSDDSAQTDGLATFIDAIHVNAGDEQSIQYVGNTSAGKDQGLSYFLAGAQLVTDNDVTFAGLISTTKIVFRASAGELDVPAGGERTFRVRVWFKPKVYAATVPVSTLHLRIKPDQDVVVDGSGSRLAFDQTVVESNISLTCSSGRSCDDDKPCTYNDTCGDAHICVGAVTISCVSTSCLTRACNGTTTCSETPKTGVACNDNNINTTGDTCTAQGTCVGTSGSGCALNASCNDGNLCTFNDKCNASGSCIGTSITCEGTICVDKMCNGTSSCTVTSKTGTLCNDNNACTHADACNSSGLCSGTTVTCNSDACNTRSCNGTSTCTTVSNACGVACDDGDPCTYGDTRDGSNVCVGTRITCENDSCNTRSCNGTSSCTVSPKTGETCDDNDLCTYGDICNSSGVCGGTLIQCDDDICNAAACNGTSECTLSPKIGEVCSDDDMCTYADICTVMGLCGGTAISCESDTCNMRMCNGTDACTVTPTNDASCDDTGSGRNADGIPVDDGGGGGCNNTAATNISLVPVWFVFLLRAAMRRRLRCSDSDLTLVQSTPSNTLRAEKNRAVEHTLRRYVRCSDLQS